jgi:hypothetical protein
MDEFDSDSTIVEHFKFVKTLLWILPIYISN